MAPIEDLKVAILIVSDTASEDPTTDRAGRLLKDVFSSAKQVNWLVARTEIVPDSIPQIQKYIKQWTDTTSGEEVNLIVTTGGTGFAQKDITPEAIDPMLDKKAPGLMHGMMAASMAVTPFAIMSRLIAGVRRNTIIITVPGSPKGAKENLEAILKLLPHACMQVAGMDSRALHSGGVKKLEQDAGVSTKPHSHSHDHHTHTHTHSHTHGHSIPKPHTEPSERPQSNDPTQGSAARYRSSPYPLVSVQSAIETILANTPDPEVITLPVTPELTGYTLAHDVTAKESVPAFRASIVDGYAVIAGPEAPSTKGEFPVVGVSHASADTNSSDNPSASRLKTLQQGEIARITTGAPLPPGATSVVMVEDTVVQTRTPDGKEEARVEILTDKIQPGENVREVGSDVQAGTTILARGERISSSGGEIGLLASVGTSTVQVYRRPIVGVLSTGDEIVPHDRAGDLRLGEVRDTNRVALLSVLQGWGIPSVDLGIAADTPGKLEEALRLALRRCDVLVTTGGVSMGELDLLKPTIERALGGSILFGRVAMKPGKPTTFAIVDVKDAHGRPSTKLIFSLPGNPASAVVCASLFVLPCLGAWSGEVDRNAAEAWKVAGLVRTQVKLKGPVRCDASREEYQRATVALEGGRLVAATTGMQRSSRVGSFRSANALLVLPAGGGEMGSGEIMDALLLRGGLGL